MKLLVIGATGRTGKHIVEQALQRGHDVTAFTRRPQELEGITTGSCNVVQGDATTYADVVKAVVGQDAVIVAVSHSGIIRVLLPAMRETEVRRIVMTSSRSITGTKPAFAIGLAWLMFRAAYADTARAEGMLEASDLDWSIVRATMLTDKPALGHVHMDFEANATGGDWTLTRADYAMTLLDVTENPQMIHKIPGVGGAKPIDARKPQAA